MSKIKSFFGFVTGVIIVLQIIGFVGLLCVAGANYSGFLHKRSVRQSDYQVPLSAEGMEL